MSTPSYILLDNNIDQIIVEICKWTKVNIQKTKFLEQTKQLTLIANVIISIKELIKNKNVIEQWFPLE